MLKKLSFFAALALIAAGCNNKEERAQVKAPVNVRVSNFTTSIEDIAGTKDGTAVGSYNGVKALTLAFYDSNSTEVYKSTQLKGSAGFGEFSLSLPLGSYTMVVLGYGFYEDDVFSLTSPSLASFTTDCRETFASTSTVSVTGPSALELTATLDRIVAKLMVVSTDGRPEGVARIRMGFSGGSKTFNPSTGLATSNTTFSNSVGVSSAVGATTSSVCYLFLTSDEQSLNVTIDVLDSDGNVLNQKTVSGVSFQRNRCTRLTGSVYTVSTAADSFLLNKDWLEGDLEQSF